MSPEPGLHVVRHHSRPTDGSPTVVLVHGSLDRGASFSRVVRRLGDLHVVTYDRRGYAHSRQVRPLGELADHVADLVALVGDGPAVVVGHSYGGDVALGAALEAPGAVTGVGAYEPPMPWEPWWPRRSRRPSEGDPELFAEQFFRRMVGDGAWERADARMRQERRADGAALMTELMALRSASAPFDVPSLSVPAVFGRGGDSLEHHRRAAEELHTSVSGSSLVEIAGAAHGAHLTHPNAFADFVRQAVDGSAG